MKISSTQRLIKVGSSYAVTIPAKEVRLNNLKLGTEYDMVLTEHKSSVDSHTTEVVDLTQKLIARHKTALDNLSQR